MPMARHQHGRLLLMRLQELLIIAVLSIIVIANVFDMASDMSSGASFVHLVEEGVVVLVSLVVIIGLLVYLRRQKRELEQIRREFSKQQQEALPASAELLQARKQLGSEIRRQFLDWQLTVSEQEVAMLLLKGLSFKEIAAVRETHEKTVRQQASAIYKKAGVSGRHAFSAWFIEDFL
jgi:DNA-binding CsgD family transcriptional regulator